MEFRNSITTTGVNIPALRIEYILSQVRVGVEDFAETRRTR